jgi:hypothetical protein
MNLRTKIFKDLIEEQLASSLISLFEDCSQASASIPVKRFLALSMARGFISIPTMKVGDDTKNADRRSHGT